MSPAAEGSGGAPAAAPRTDGRGPAAGAASPRAAGREERPGRLVLRALGLQAVFNAETLQGVGFGFAVLPALRRAHGAAAGARLARLSAAFNANPYLAPVAVGAVWRAEGREPPARIDRFLALVRGPLGSLGDALFWAGLRPALFVPAAAAVAAGAPWWLVGAAVSAFNAVSFAARWWGARAGLRHGLDVGAALGRSWVRRAPAWVRPAGGAAIGLVCGLALAAGT
ncbi:MAG TPA: PTS system mannose/fructose/sorbose family transporter subunit IID, partial [Gemmatimonadota bacterium]